MPCKGTSTTINWSDEENQRRLLAAMYAACTGAKPNNKDIAKFFGKNATESAINNQMRKVKAQAKQLESETSDDYEVPVRQGASKRKAKNDETPVAKVVKPIANVLVTPSQTMKDKCEEKFEDAAEYESGDAE
ncbi:hypothetical protein EV356DRAFT_528971 [Viridothelium virens]|uniref:Myb-like domain-containing protein n=1 Tax=Viridothelium virens TaxID=1048519 RepID=A0A6A6HLT7_VIRVR|nr:hypothetical protein EV356DRAFT_528971 [Viridothelium virens]